MNRDKVASQQPLVPETEVETGRAVNYSVNSLVQETINPMYDLRHVYATDAAEYNFGCMKSVQPLEVIGSETLDVVATNCKNGTPGLSHRNELDHDATYLPEFEETDFSGAQAKTLSAQVAVHNAKRRKAEPSSGRETLMNTDKYIGESPSLLCNPIEKFGGAATSTIGYVSVLDKTKRSKPSPNDDASEMNQGLFSGNGACAKVSGFLSSIKNSKNVGTHLSESPSKKGGARQARLEISFSPGKRKSRKQQLKQTTLETKFVAFGKRIVKCQF